MIRTDGCLAACAAVLGFAVGCADRPSVVVSAVRGTLTASNRLAEERRAADRNGLAPQRPRPHEMVQPHSYSRRRGPSWTRFTKADIAGGFAGAIVTLA